ncbi:MAG: hypothetical protein JSS04_27050 [Proteobacteria bacterium]|nr:hypothetical protein [Pseudomonadota bacterium]
MARTSDRTPSKEQENGPAEDPRWDRKHGAAKSGRMARDVEKSSGRYSASEQSEEKGSAAATPNTTRE